MPTQSQTLLHAIHGYVRDKATGEALIGATVRIPEGKGTVTNSYGYFTLKLPQGSHQIVISYVGYIPVEQNVSLEKDLFLNFDMAIESLDEVVISDEVDIVIPSTNKLSIEQLSAVPMLLGEVDIVKSLSLTPGVSTGQEGTTGLYVRGGSPDQNLILIDDAPVYNLSHLFGFVSTFNNDAIKEVNLMKGGFPSRYGGRLSSIMDINLKEGNKKEFNAQFSIGAITSKALIEGPIKKDTTSYLISARSSYLGLLLLPLQISYQSGNAETSANYWMFDYTAKVNHRLKKGGQITASYYQGGDFLVSKDGFNSKDHSTLSLNWGNQTATVRYANALGSSSFLKIIGLYSFYDYEYGVTQTQIIQPENQKQATFYNTRSSVRDLGVKTEFTKYYLNNQELDIGAEVIRHQYNTGKLSTNLNLSEEGINTTNPRTDALELAAFIENRISIGSNIQGSIGLRSSHFQHESGWYHSLEPRLGLGYKLTKTLTAKASLTQMKQYVHLLSSSALGLSNDLWVPSTELVRPQRARQFTIGLSQTFFNKMYEVSLDFYSKTMNNLIDYRRGANILFSINEEWEQLIALHGEGIARGAEFFIHKKHGDWTGWFSYTLSKNHRRFESINNGEWYPDRYDRRHDLSITASFKMSKTWSISGTWVYSTGHSVTLPEAISYNLDGALSFVYGDRNNARMPDYHRMDLGFTRTIEKKGHDRLLSFGAYNAYNRVNPYYLNFNRSSTASMESIQLQKVSLLQFIPYISYSWKL